VLEFVIGSFDIYIIVMGRVRDRQSCNWSRV